jgi:hypothetical protein
MGQTWPENPGPEEWYIEAVPEKADERGRFSGVWLCLKSRAFPSIRHDFKFIKLQASNFDWQWDFAFKQASSMIGRLNFDPFGTRGEEPSTDALCAECNALASSNDYLCDRCRD